jgi:hypothetical protein
MKKLLAFLVPALFCTTLFAQSDKEDVAMIQAMFGKEKKDLVNQYMTIPADKSTKFWALYDEYEDKRKALGRERIDILKQYADNYQSLDDKKATELMGKKLAWQDKYGKMQTTYFKKFSEAIGGLEASKLMQLEDYIENNLRLAVQEQIPFIGELDKTKVASQKN